MEPQQVHGKNNQVDHFDLDYHVDCVYYYSDSSTTTDPHPWWIEAKQKLSKHAFVKHYQQITKTAKYWEVQQAAASDVEIFCPGQDPDSVIQIPVGQQCPCPKWVMHEIQCKHKYCANGCVYELEKYSSWHL